VPFFGPRQNRTSFSWRINPSLNVLELDHVTRNRGGVTGQDPGPEPVFLDLGIDHGIAALGLNGSILRANKAVVLLDRDNAEQQQTSGFRFAVANDGVLAAIQMLGFHRSARATADGQDKQQGGDDFAYVLQGKTPWRIARDSFLKRSYSNGISGRLESLNVSKTSEAAAKRPCYLTLLAGHPMPAKG
jgi:hypothetical protein